MFVLGSVAYAQNTEEQQAQGAAAEGELIVTARRRPETLQEVPSTVNVVTDEALQENVILTFEDITDLVPGVELDTGAGGYRANVTMRGVEFSPDAQATSQTTAFYMNDAPIDPNIMFQAQYDIGQIEVLKGPQGTDRGISSPSGAFTTTTRAADPTEGFTGYVSSAFDDHEGINLQGGVNIPIIENVFAMRLAGVRDRTDGDGIYSATGGPDPYEETDSYRVSFAFTPFESFRARAMFQEIDRQSANYVAQFGSGLCLANPAVAGGRCTPANTNPDQPQLSMGQYASASDRPEMWRHAQHVAIVNLEYAFAGQLLSYTGSWFRHRLNVLGDGDTYNYVNAFVTPDGSGSIQDRSGQVQYTNELRLQSEEPLFNGLLDYTVGAFMLDSDVQAYHPSPASYFTGAFGPDTTVGPGPGTPNPNIYNPAYTLHFWTFQEREFAEESIFGTINLHLLDDLELSLGGRQIVATRNMQTYQELGGMFSPRAGFPAPPTIMNLGPLPSCAAVPGAFASTNYPGTCDINVAAPGNGVVVPLGPRVNDEKRPEVYNISVSYDLTDDVMVYATHGTSWRNGPGYVIASPGSTCASAAYCQRFVELGAEESSVYEAGLKAYLFDRRAYIEFSVYDQSFDGYLLRGGSAPYLTNSGTVQTSAAQSTWTYNADVQVSGFDVLFRYDVTDDWNVGFSASYNDGEFDGSTLIPCRDSNFDGVPDNGPTPTTQAAWLLAGGPQGPALCPAQGSSMNTPPWSLNLRTDYEFPLFGSMLGFVRGNYNYYPENENVDLSDEFIVDSYGILNLFAGIQDEDGVWEITAFVKNVFDEDTILRDSTAVDNVSGQTWTAPNVGFRNAGAANAPFFPTTTGFGVQYNTFSRLAEREIGVTLRYTF
jgi:iron complex outermembrane receptor protein